MTIIKFCEGVHTLVKPDEHMVQKQLAGGQWDLEKKEY